jgi:ATP-dependent protease ClpP protease subunit/cell division protein FtsB
MNLNEFKHVKNITSDGVANIYLFDEIGRSVDPLTGSMKGIDGQRFADELDWLSQRDDVQKINVRINSVGGSVIDGFSIFSAIKNSPKSVDTYVDGLGASIAGIIFQAGEKRYISDFGRIMIHEPALGKPVELLNDKQRNALNSFRDQLIAILTSNSKLSSDEISSIMSAETWFSAKETTDKGLADEIVNTGRVINEVEKMDAETLFNVTNSLILNNSFNNNQKINKMELIKNHFGFDANVDEQTIVNKVIEVETALITANETIETVTTENETLKAENDALKAEKQQMNDDIATNAVETAITNGLIDDTKRDEMLTIAKNNLNVFESVLKSIKRTPAKVTNTITPGTSNPAVSLRELEKSNPAEIERLINHEPEKYKQMYFEQYGTEPSI